MATADIIISQRCGPWIFSSIEKEHCVIPDDQALALHDRSTRGQPLSAEERTVLECWYAEQDRAEETALRSSLGTESVDDVQRELAVALARLTDVSLRIKEIVSQNDAISEAKTRHCGTRSPCDWPARWRDDQAA